jgi:hypothetical protein
MEATPHNSPSRGPPYGYEYYYCYYYSHIRVSFPLEFGAISRIIDAMLASFSLLTRYTLMQMDRGYHSLWNRDVGTKPRSRGMRSSSAQISLNGCITRSSHISLCIRTGNRYHNRERKVCVHNLVGFLLTVLCYFSSCRSGFVSGYHAVLMSKAESPCRRSCSTTRDLHPSNMRLFSYHRGIPRLSRKSASLAGFGCLLLADC